MNIQLEAKGFFQKMWGNTGYSNKLSAFSAQFSKIDKEMQIYRLQMHIQTFDPVMPLIKLILGAFAIVVSILVFVNM